MQLSLAGALICIMLILAARWSGGLLAVLIASLTFGATSVVSLTALGGSSPLVFSVLQILLICTVILKRSFVRDLWSIFSQQPLAWIILIFVIYVISGAVILPRLFLGQTTAFVPIKSEFRIAEIPLSPVSGNVTQTLYFVLNALTFFAVYIILSKSASLKVLRNGFFLWAALLIGTGLVDLFGKLVGAGDLLAPLRSASYSMLTNIEEAGFFRIAGAYSEASAFGSATVITLAFTFTYWRATRELVALNLSIILLILLLLSTSSSAYAGAAIISIPLFFVILKSSLSNRITRQDVFLLSCGIATLLIVIAINLYDEKALDPLWDLINSTILNKASSASGRERAYWNLRSIDSFFDTVGLGIGMGSSRASSWVVAVISQLGVIGTLFIAALVYQIFSGKWVRMTYPDVEEHAIALSLRSAALAALVTGSIAGSGADPGVIFFTTLAVSSCLKQQRGFAVQAQNASNFLASRQLAPGDI